MTEQSPGERLRASFASDLKRLNGLLDAGDGSRAKELARRLAPQVYLAIPGHRAGELYDKLKSIAGCTRFPARIANSAA